MPGVHTDARLVWIASRSTNGGFAQPLSFPDYVDFRDSSGVFTEAAAVGNAEFSLASGGVTAGYALGHGWIDTVVCAGVEAGSVSARGAGLLNSRSVHDLWLAPHAGLELSAHPGGGFTVFVRGEAVVPLFRQSYAVNDILAASASVDTIASVGARLAAGALIAF